MSTHCVCNSEQILMDTHSPSFSTFRKKTYCKLTQPPLARSTPAEKRLPPAHEDNAKKKIIPSSATKGLREEFKKIFLPLLSDIFELRQAIETHKAASEPSLPLGKVQKSPQEILDRLKQLQKEIEESQRWCEGVVGQLAKGIKEAKEVVLLLKQPQDPPSQKK